MPFFSGILLITFIVLLEGNCTAIGISDENPNDITNLLYNMLYPREEIDLKIAYEWKKCVYSYETDEEEQSDIWNGIYEPGRAYPVDIGVSYPRSEYFERFSLIKLIIKFDYYLKFCVNARSYRNKNISLTTLLCFEPKNIRCL